MLRNVASEILNLIKQNKGLDKQIVFSGSNVEVQKIIDIILNESKCSIRDANGNYVFCGSNIDERIVENIVKTYLSETTQMPPETVSMALTKEGIIGPFVKLDLVKEYDEANNIYLLNLEQLFPENVSAEIFDESTSVKDEFVMEVVLPYIKNIVFENDVLMSKSPVGAWISKKTSNIKNNDEILQDLKKIIKNVKSLKNVEEDKIENIANYIWTNILNNKKFKEELISNSLHATELQKLGHVYTGFNGLLENMVNEVLQMLDLRELPYSEYTDMQDIFYNAVAVLYAFSTNFEQLDEMQILESIEVINRNFNLTSKKNKSENAMKCKYRTQDIHADRYDNIVDFVQYNDIKEAMVNLCKMIKVLLEKKDEIGMETYIKEVLRIHYRFLRIMPFEKANGRTARAIVNILLQSKEMIGIFRKEKRKEYINFIKEAHAIIKPNEFEYIKNLTSNPMECVEIENQFLNKELPFLLVKY